LWGDTDSEDDEEFLKRGIIANQQWRNDAAMKNEKWKIKLKTKK
jgi:hypothetical protein